MSRFNYENSENYSRSGSGTNYFKLVNDGDTARVRFMYNTMDDIEGMAVHQIELPDGKKKYVNCLREYDQPLDDCPLCKKGYRVLPKVFITLYNEDEGQVQIWERGIKWLKKLNGLCKRHNPLVGAVVEIERDGKPRDTKTEYQTYDEDDDGTTLEDLPEAPEVLGTIVLDKSYEELEAFIETGDFEATKPVRRRARDEEDEEDEEEEERPSRRTRRTPRGKGF